MKKTTPDSTYLVQLHQALEDFLGVNYGPLLSRWQEITERDNGLLLRVIKELRFTPNVEKIALECDECWNLVNSPILISRIRLFYPGASIGLATRLANNARTMFASGVSAAAARRAYEGESTSLALFDLWLGRAVGTQVHRRNNDGSPLTAQQLILDSLATVQPVEIAATVATWMLWCLDENLPKSRTSRRVPYVAITTGLGELDFVRLTTLELPYVGLIEDPKSALVPLEDSWIRGIERAWSLVVESQNQYALYAVRLTTGTRSSGRVLKGASASGGIAVGLKSLLTGLPSDPSRLVLASLDENLSHTLRRVGKIPDKLEVAAKHGGVRHVALAYTRQPAAGSNSSADHVESIPEVAEFRERCPNSRLSVSTVETFDEAFRFATEQVTSIRGYLKHIQKQPLGITQDAVSMIDPYLTEIDSPPSMIGSSGPYALDAVAESGTKRRFAYRMLFRTLFERVGSYILVTAPPGYGKTLLASRIARELAAETEASLESGKATFEDASNKLVLLLEADAMLATVGPTNSSATPDDLTRRCLIESASATYKVGEPVFEFIVERALSHDTGSSVVIIIDALDRLSPEQRILLMPVLNAIVNWPCVVILTTRQIPTEIPRSAAVHYELLPFSAAQIRRFITQRFSESRVQQRLIETIRRNLRLAHSATVPQVLSWLCDVFQDVALPSTRAALLGKIIDTISITPHSTDEGRKDALRIVEHVAHEWWFSSDGIAPVSRTTVCKWIKEVMGDSLPLRVSRRLSEQLSDDEIARKWLTQFVETGVLVPTSADDERLGWIHDSVLEGFAAKFSARCTDAADLAERLADRRTRELLPLVAGYLKEPSQLLNKLLIGPDPFHRRLMLAAYCLSECDPSEQSPDLYLRDVATRIMDQLVFLLESPAASDRKRAADAIWWCAAWCDALIEKRLEALLLVPASPKTAAVAAESLVAIARDKLHDSLFPYLTDGQARIRAHAIRRLGMLEDERLPQLFTKLINDSSPDVQIAAIDALAEIGTKDSIESLLTALESPSRWCRSAAANALSDLGDAVADQLWQIATGGAPQAREAAIEALAMMELLWDESLDQFSKIQNDSNHSVRATFATVLGAAPRAFAMRPLLRLIGDHNAKVRLCALASLERLGNVDAAETVATMLNDPVELVRLRAAATLVLFDRSSHEQRIIDRLNTGTFGKEVLAMLVHSRGPAAVRVLTQCVQSYSPLRIPAARALASLRIRESIPHLIRLLTDSDESARIAGIEGLGVIGGSDAIEPLFLRLEDRSVLVKSAAAESLGRIGDVRAAVPLSRCLDSNDSKLRFNARQALSRLLPVSELLETTLSNGSPRGRVAVDLYEALCQSIDLADFWDFGKLEGTLAALTSSVTYGKSGPMPEYTFTQ